MKGATGGEAYSYSDKHFREACKVILGADVGALKDYEQWLFSLKQPMGNAKSSVSGTPLALVSPDFPQAARYLTMGEASAAKPAPFSVNEIKDIDSLFSIENIVEPYWKELLRDTSADRSHGQRIFLARSDPAMNSGLVPAVLAVRAALAKAHEVGGCLGFDVFPILGTGSLPFRGSVNPTYTETFLNQYAGTSTYSIQSAFRYDYPLADVRSALELMHREVPMRKGTPMTDHERAKVRDLAELFVAAWGSSIESIAPIINQIAAFVPSRRERLLHIGLFGYSRGVGAVKLPRAIVFTAALYSLGVPPELIATGRGLRAAAKAKLMPLLDSHYPALREDIVHAGKYFNAENLSLLAAQYPAFEEIKEDIAGIEEILGITLGPVKPHHVIHRNITSTILHRLATPDSAAITRDIVEAGVIRRSLG